MTGRSTPAEGGVTDDPIRIGTLLYTLVEPHRGHQVEYNRWYERDHFYAGCQIGAYNFAGARFVATAPLKELRYPEPGPDGAEPLVADPQVGSYLGLYFVLDGHHDEWNRWAVDQVNVLHAAGRMYDKRDHIHTGLYRFEWEDRRDEDGVPAELTLDHRFPGLVSVFVEPGEGVTLDQVGAWYREEYLPSVLPGSAVATVLAFSPLPLLADAPGDVPRSETRRPAPAPPVVPRRRARGRVGRGLRRSGRRRRRRRVGPGGVGIAVHRHRARARTPTPTSCGRPRHYDRLRRGAGRADRRPRLGRRRPPCGSSSSDGPRPLPTRCWPTRTPAPS